MQDEQNVREVLEGAFHSIFGREPDKVHDLEWLTFRDRERRFRRFLDAEAWTSAAEMLIPTDGSMALLDIKYSYGLTIAAIGGKHG